MRMERIWNYVDGLKPVMFMVIAQVTFAAVNVLYKLAAHAGMSLRVIVAYRFIFAAAFMVPIALIVERKRPKLTGIVLLQAFLCGLFGGSVYHNLYLEGLVLTSTTFVCAMVNLTPAVTFVLAISFRMEKAGLRTMSGRAKMLGTLMGIGGAMLLTFYKGVQLINSSFSHLDLLRRHNQATAAHAASSHAASPNRALGGLAALGCCICYALWLIIQAKMSERYPCHCTSTALLCLMAAIQSVILALCTEKDRSQWRLGWNIKLLTVVYAGIIGTGLMFLLIAWCVNKRGPLFVSVFTPLTLVLVAFAGALLLEEKLYVGSILGTVLIVLGLFLVLWGKAKEMKKTAQSMSSMSPPETESIKITVTSPGTGSASLKSWNNELEEKEAADRRDVKEEKEDVETASN